jgi:hypothetical protein
MTYHVGFLSMYLRAMEKALFLGVPIQRMSRRTSHDGFNQDDLSRWCLDINVILALRHKSTSCDDGRSARDGENVGCSVCSCVVRTPFRWNLGGMESGLRYQRYPDLRQKSRCHTTSHHSHQSETGVRIIQRETRRRGTLCWTFNYLTCWFIPLKLFRLVKEEVQHAILQR